MGETVGLLLRENAIARLREVMETRELGAAWKSLLGEIQHQGTVYGVTSAAIPHLVDLAPHLPAESRLELWTEIGFLVTAGADRFPAPPAEGLQEGLTAALGTAEVLALRDFLAGTDSSPDDDSYFALTCVALAGHPVGRAIWKFPSQSSGYMQMDCPGCGAEAEVDGFADPVALPCPVPHFGPAQSVPGPWRDVADALERTRRDQVLGPGWGRFIDTARRVALPGVPAHASRSAGWCLVAAMVALRSAASAPWARTLARLTGYIRCLDCGSVWAIADAMDDRAEARPVDAADTRLPDGYVQDALFAADEDGNAGDRVTDGVWPETVADAVGGFRPAPGRALDDARLSARLLWSVGEGPASTLAPVAGQDTPTVVVRGGSQVTLLRHGASGAATGRKLGAGPGTGTGPVASAVLPDGTAVIAAAGDDGSMSWWDAATGMALEGSAVGSTDPVLSLAPVLMPASRGRIYGPLASLAGSRKPAQAQSPVIARAKAKTSTETLR